MKPLLPYDLTRECINGLKTINGQVEGLGKLLASGNDPEMILIQFKAIESGLQKIYHLLVDEVYRKALAIKISEVAEACPGNCGHEEGIEMMRKQFPNYKKDDLIGKFNEVAILKSHIDSKSKL